MYRLPPRLERERKRVGGIRFRKQRKVSGHHDELARAKSISTELTLFPRSTCTHLDPRLSRPNTHHPERYELPLYFRPTLSNKAFATIGPTSHCACRDSHTPSHLHVHTRVHTCTWWLRGISRQWLEHTGGGEGRGKNDEGVLNGSQFLLRIVIFVLRWLHGLA